MRIIREDNPRIKIHISTNGALVKGREKQDAALLCDYIQFSIDGSAQDELAKYQRRGDFAQAYANMAELVRYRDEKGQMNPIIEWKYVVFSWNDSEEQISRAVDMAKKANVDIISFFRGTGPRIIRSRKYLNAPYFNAIPMHDWRGRVIDFRTNGRFDKEWAES
jgi:MoaA/NifB/PqqE/SkfB family radical SAM enzyme